MRSTGKCTMLVVAGVLVLTGCAEGSADLYSGEQDDADVLPATLNAEGRGWDTDSSRLLATHEDTQFYVVAGAEGDCLITYDPTSTEDWNGGCTPGGRVGTSGPLGITTDFAPAGLPGKTPEGWERLTPELQIRTR